MNAALAWWKSKTTREQRLLAGAVAAVLLVVIWQFVLNPVLSYRAEARRNYASAVELMDEIQSGAREAAELRRNAAAAPSRPEGPVRALVTGAAREMGLTVSRTQPGEGGALTLWLEDADPALLYRWLARVERDLGVPVEQVTLRKNEGRATVRANVLIREGGA